MVGESFRSEKSRWSSMKWGSAFQLFLFAELLIFSLALKYANDNTGLGLYWICGIIVFLSVLLTVQTVYSLR